MLFCSFVSSEIKKQSTFLLSQVYFMNGRRRGSRPLSVFFSLITWIAARFFWYWRKATLECCLWLSKDVYLSIPVLSHSPSCEHLFSLCPFFNFYSLISKFIHLYQQLLFLGMKIWVIIFSHFIGFLCPTSWNQTTASWENVFWVLNNQYANTHWLQFIDMT